VAGVWFSFGTLVSNKTDYHNINEILLKYKRRYLIHIYSNPNRYTCQRTLKQRWYNVRHCRQRYFSVEATLMQFPTLFPTSFQCWYNVRHCRQRYFSVEATLMQFPTLFPTSFQCWYNVRHYLQRYYTVDMTICARRE
jgi:hypothetical protein